MPYIADSLEEDLAGLVELEEQLPDVDLQLRSIRKVYDRGRGKVSSVSSPLSITVAYGSRAVFRRNNSWHRSNGSTHLSPRDSVLLYSHLMPLSASGGSSSS